MYNSTLMFKNTAVGVYEMSIFENPITKSVTVSYGKFGGAKTSNTLPYKKGLFDKLVRDKKRDGYIDISNLSIKINKYTTEDKIKQALPKFAIDLDGYHQPMKCKPFVAEKFTYPALAQPKINGNRGTIRWGMIDDGLFSHEGVILKSHGGDVLKIDHIAEAAALLYENPNNRNIVFDGEFYVYGQPVTSISGACRNTKNSIHNQIQFLCFDLAIPDVLQSHRITLRDKIFAEAYLHKKNDSEEFIELQESVEHHKDLKARLVCVITDFVYDDNDANDYRNRCLAAGFEGCVIRDLNATYQFGRRPMTMMKLKRFKIGMFTVVDMRIFGYENTTNDVGKGCVFICKNDTDDQTFESNLAGNAQFKLDVYNNRADYIGKQVAVKYGERSANNLPFHSNVILDGKETD